MSGKGETKVGLREGGDRTAESGRHRSCGVVLNFYGDKSALVKVDGKTSGSGEGVQKRFKVVNMLRNSADDDEGVVSILENRAGEIIHQRMKQKAVPRSREQKLLEHVSDDVKQERGQRVPLSQTSPALDPPTWDAIQKNSGLARVVERANPSTPTLGEAFGTEDLIQGLPTDGVKGFAKVKLEDSSRGRAAMAGLDDVSGIDKVFSDRPTRDEPGLVGVNEKGDKFAKAKGKAFGVDFKAAVLKGDRTKVIRAVSTSFFGKEDNVRLINGAKVGV
jgi:hypothetical protein